MYTLGQYLKLFFVGILICCSTDAYNFQLIKSPVKNDGCTETIMLSVIRNQILRSR